MNTAHARATDPQTSHDAAASVDPRLTTRLQASILVTLHGLDGPASHTELYESHHAFAVSPSGFRTRVKELVDGGMVEDSGDRHVLPSGRNSIRWQLTEHGHHIAQAIIEAMS